MAEINWTVRDKFSKRGRLVTESLLSLFEEYEIALRELQETDTQYDHARGVKLVAKLGEARLRLQDCMYDAGMCVTQLEERRP